MLSPFLFTKERKYMSLLQKIKIYSIGVLLFLVSLIAHSNTQGLSKSEIKCLQDMAYHEARGESTKGMVATIFVTLNRMKDPRFPSNACKVVHQPNQYSWSGKGYTIKEPDLYERSKAVVRDVLSGKHTDYSRGAIFFNAHHRAPVSGAVCTTRIGGHSFYKK